MSTASTTSRFGTMRMAILILLSMIMPMTSMVIFWHQWWWNGKETSEFLPLRAPQGRLEKRVPKLTIVTISKLSLFRFKAQTILKRENDFGFHLIKFNRHIMALLLVSSKVTQSQLAMMICHLLLPFTVPLTAEEAVQCQNNLGQRQKNI